MKPVKIAIFAAFLLASLLSAAVTDFLFPTGLQTHYIPLTAASSTPNTAIYTTNVWLKSIVLIPQSTTSPTCTAKDGLGNFIFNAAQLAPNINYVYALSDTAPLLAVGGITLSCSDTTVKYQMLTLY